MVLSGPETAAQRDLVVGVVGVIANVQVCR